ncbi:Uncharacterised protein [Mycobacteroides abscessus subsp. abscessus]|nr:Uncharacterised protein [Mycobacteroides abscessus subsp. abscessus]
MRSSAHAESGVCPAAGSAVSTCPVDGLPHSPRRVASTVPDSVVTAPP